MSVSSPESKQKGRFSHGHAQAGPSFRRGSHRAEWAEMVWGLVWTRTSLYSLLPGSSTMTLRAPQFDQLLRVLRRQVPERPTLFEFFLNGPLEMKLAGRTADPKDYWDRLQMGMEAFAVAGYDYYTLWGTDFMFPRKEVAHGSSRSMNETAVISDRATFDAYAWPDPDAHDYSRLDHLAPRLPKGMKFIVFGPGGVLENVMELVGYEPLAYMIMDDPGLAQEIFDCVGSRLVRYYQRCGSYPSVGALISNDDWGFNSQTMLAPEHMRQFVFPWHRKIVQAIHAAGKPAILHSCGNLAAVMDDIIDDLGYDAKHSFEDKILPVEEAYDRFGHRIAILGGIDLDFVCRSAPSAVTARSKAMLERTAKRGGYALGTGNSVPTYVPHENYLAMLAAVQPGIRFPTV
jgi:uroporphyrinogen decarboxylase